MTIAYEWRGAFDNAELNELHAEGFDHEVLTFDWLGQVEHSLGWVCARDADALVGWVNVAWDGSGHAFILDTLVAGRARRQGVGTELVARAADRVREAGCEWLHVDFEDHLRDFYFGACGFRPTNAGLIELGGTARRARRAHTPPTRTGIGRRFASPAIGPHDR